MKFPMYSCGLITGFCAAALYFMAPAIIDSFRPEPPTPPEVEKHGTFTVVSQYKGCDLVQWQYGMLSEYKYFLHCPK